MFKLDSIIKVEISDCVYQHKKSPSIGKLSEEAEPDYSNFTIDTINKPITLKEFIWAWSKCGSGAWLLGHMPWMNLELGSYEQVRMIFDYHSDSQYHDTCVNIIHSCNRVLEERYSESRSTVGSIEFDDHIHNYCDEGFASVAAGLRSGTFDSGSAGIFARQCVEVMDRYMDDSIEFRGSVWRGMSMPVASYEQFRNNGSILFKNFVSTSIAPIMYNHGIVECRNLHINKPTADVRYNPDFPNRQIKINMHIDCSGIKHIVPAKITGYPEECEIILDRNTVIVIDEVFEYLDHPNSSTAKCLIRAKALPLSQFNGPTLVV
ncbi:hypothetical protein [Aeromonas phage L9-6]|nr:hypothetical protein [Aeromonas phage L9-6]